MSFLEYPQIEQYLKEISDLVNFFSYPYEKQLIILPQLPAPRTYGFPDGDLTTHRSLLVLANCYCACLNKISIRAIDEIEIPEFDELHYGIDWTIEMMCYDDDSSFNPEKLEFYGGWEVIRQLSKSLKKVFLIQDNEITQASLWKYLDES